MLFQETLEIVRKSLNFALWNRKMLFLLLSLLALKTLVFPFFRSPLIAAAQDLMGDMVVEQFLVVSSIDQIAYLLFFSIVFILTILDAAEFDRKKKATFNLTAVKKHYLPVLLFGSILSVLVTLIVSLATYSDNFVFYMFVPWVWFLTLLLAFTPTFIVLENKSLKSGARDSIMLVYNNLSRYVVFYLGISLISFALNLPLLLLNYFYGLGSQSLPLWIFTLYPIEIIALPLVAFSTIFNIMAHTTFYLNNNGREAKK
ncbi:MAG: hypothetical protein HY519_02090 [Candidatus Aenigmarchaeota archaeon]|nr:hypothetical protein [Candidatus Aenigmarchaeota archaeon]